MRSRTRKHVYYYLVILSFIVVSIMLVVSAAYISKHKISISSKAAGTMPIKGTFFMADFPYTSDASMEPLFIDMKRMGITTIIFLASGVLERTPCVQGSTGPYKESSTLDTTSQYRMGMRLAKKYGMNIYMGTTQPSLTCIKPWEGLTSDPLTDKGRLIDYNDRQITLLEQIFNSEGWNIQDPFFQGFYVSTEMDIQSSTDVRLMEYYTELTKRMKNRYPNKHILISPWKMESTSYADARQHFVNIYTKMSVDIIAPQDSLGTKNTSTYTRNADHFRALYDASVAVGGKQAWANIESFKKSSTTAGAFEPTDIASLTNQLESAKPYVSNYITWIYQHTLAIEPQLNGYSTWTNAYGIDDSVKRIHLRHRYDERFVYNLTQIDNIFVYGQNLVIKGPRLGEVGTSTTFVVTFINASNQIVTKEMAANVNQEDLQTAYISLTNLPGINTTKPFTASVKPIVPPPSPTLTPTSTPILKPGDANGDGKVDGIDYMIWRSHYNQRITGPSNGDFDNNGIVDGIDYMIWRTNYAG